MKIILPVQLNPVSRRKDRSVKLSYETRELTPSEIMTLMSLEGEEGWLLFASERAEIEDSTIPTTKPDIGIKSQSELLRNALFVYFKQEEKKGNYVGTFENFYNLYLEKYRQHILGKLDKE